MKRAAPLFSVRPAAAFTLIEMIGVLAIMAIMASVLVPNVLRTMDRAAVDAEQKTLDALGDQVKEYIRGNGAAPTSIWPDLANLAQRSWCSDLADFSDLPTRDIAVNRRDNIRVILFEPGAVPQRFILISSMHAGPALPDFTYAPNAGQFQQIWDTPEEQVPPTTSWNGWANWRVLDGNNQMWLRHYLLIERIDLRPIYGRHVDVRVWNKGATTATYWEEILGALPRPIAKDEVLTVPMKPGVVLCLSPNASGTSPVRYPVQVIPPGAPAPCFVFDGTTWTPQ